MLLVPPPPVLPKLLDLQSHSQQAALSHALSALSQDLVHALAGLRQELAAVKAMHEELALRQQRQQAQLQKSLEAAQQEVGQLLDMGTKGGS